MSAATSGTGVSLVFVTVPSADVGRKIANSLVENKLAACVSIVPGLESIYSWKGKLERDEELLLKVRDALAAWLLLCSLTDWKRRVHACWCWGCGPNQPRTLMHATLLLAMPPRRSKHASSWCQSSPIT